MGEKLSDLDPGTCFQYGRKRTLAKKVSDDRVAVIGKKGQVRTRKARGNPSVERVACPLGYIGVGLRYPEQVVEMGCSRRRRT